MSLMQSWSEARPPKPTLTEEHVPDLHGRVYVITGGSSGIGLELARILYWKNARVYLAGRSAESFGKAVQDIQATPAVGITGSSKGELAFMQLDLMDLRTIKPAVEAFLEKEDTLHTVWYNAGVMIPPKGSKTVQGYELQWGTNVVGHFVLHCLLTPILISSARKLPLNTVRVIWVSSIANMQAPSPTGINWTDINNTKGRMLQWRVYGQSKAGGIILGYEAAQRLGREGIVSLALSPGHLKTPLQRHVPSWQMRFMNWMLYAPRFGALTELYAGFSTDYAADKNNGAFIIPWGRPGLPRKDILAGCLSEGTGKRLWDMLDREVQEFL